LVNVPSCAQFPKIIHALLSIFSLRDDYTMNDPARNVPHAGDGLAEKGPFSGGNQCGKRRLAPQ
jgi:hypothetical protein